MPAWLGNGIVIAILICACCLAVRSIWKARTAAIAAETAEAAANAAGGPGADKMM